MSYSNIVKNSDTYCRYRTIGPLSVKYESGAGIESILSRGDIECLVCIGQKCKEEKGMLQLFIGRPLKIGDREGKKRISYITFNKGENGEIVINVRIESGAECVITIKQESTEEVSPQLQLVRENKKKKTSSILNNGDNTTEFIPVGLSETDFARITFSSASYFYEKNEGDYSEKTTLRVKSLLPQKLSNHCNIDSSRINKITRKNPEDNVFIITLENGSELTIIVYS